MKKFLIWLYTVFMIGTIAGFSSAETITCAECGMTSELSSRFTVMLSQDGGKLYFCDIGDFFVYVNKKKKQQAPVQVRDYPSGEWLDGQKACFVKSPEKFNSPMGWGVAAFKDKKQAEAYGACMDYRTALKAVR